MTADVITGADDAAMAVLDNSAEQLEEQLKQLIASQDQKVAQTAEQVLHSQAQQASIFKIELLTKVLDAFGQQCDGLDLLVSLDPGVRRREFQATARQDSEVGTVVLLWTFFICLVCICLVCLLCVVDFALLFVCCGLSFFLFLFCVAFVCEFLYLLCVVDFALLFVFV